MPICSATRRASYTSSSEQQRPVAPSVESSGNRLWFHSCMVSPTTLRPSRTKSAATVELSTPPLIATAMGCSDMHCSDMNCSGMHGNSAQVRDRGFERFHERVHLLDCVETAERESHAGARAVGC